MCLFLKWREVRAATRERAPRRPPAHLSYFNFEKKQITHSILTNVCLSLDYEGIRVISVNRWNMSFKVETF